MPALSALSVTVSSTSPAPCSKIERCLTPASKAKNLLDKWWESLTVEGIAATAKSLGLDVDGSIEIAGKIDI